MNDPVRQPDETLWDVADVARYLKVSKATVRRRVLHEEIPFHKVGHFVRFRRAEIEAWVESGRKQIEEGAA